MELVIVTDDCILANIKVKQDHKNILTITTYRSRSQIVLLASITMIT